MKKKIIITVPLIILLALGLTAYLTRASLFEAFNQSPASVTVTELSRQPTPASPQETAENTDALSMAPGMIYTVPSAQSRYSIYKALTTDRTEASPADAPYFFDVRIAMKNSDATLCRVWLNPDTGRAWVSATQESGGADRHTDPASAYQLSTSAAAALLKQSAFQGVYLESVWPQAAQLTQTTSAGASAQPLYAQTIDIRRAHPTQNKTLSFTRAYTDRPPQMVTVTDFDHFSVTPAGPADSVSVTYYALAVSDLAAAAAGTLDLNGRPAVQPQQSGHYAAAYTLTYGAADPSYRGSVGGTFLMTLTSGVQPALSHSSYPQGTAGCVALAHAGPSETHSYQLQLPFCDEALPFTTGDDGVTAAYFPVANNVKPGQYTAKILVQTSVPSPGGTLTSSWFEIASVPVTVEKKNFTRQDLPATTEMVSLAVPENYAFDNEKVAAAKARSNPTPYWQGTFIRPADGRLSTYYGEERYVKGTFTNFHSGIDIACDADVPIAAAAAGKIVLAFPLRISGNTVIIDHGAGVFSSYSHLNACTVKEGDMVSAGDIVGTCGSTGYSTGPHLHFTVSCNAVTFDPLWLMEQNLWDKAAAKAREH